MENKATQLKIDADRLLNEGKFAMAYKIYQEALTFDDRNSRLHLNSKKVSRSNLFV